VWTFETLPDEVMDIIVGYLVRPRTPYVTCSTAPHISALLRTQSKVLIRAAVRSIDISGAFGEMHWRAFGNPEYVAKADDYMLVSRNHLSLTSGMSNACAAVNFDFLFQMIGYLYVYGTEEVPNISACVYMLAQMVVNTRMYLSKWIASLWRNLVDSREFYVHQLHTIVMDQVGDVEGGLKRVEYTQTYGIGHDAESFGLELVGPNTIAYDCLVEVESTRELYKVMDNIVRFLQHSCASSLRAFHFVNFAASKSYQPSWAVRSFEVTSKLAEFAEMEQVVLDGVVINHSQFVMLLGKWKKLTRFNALVRCETGIDPFVKDVAYMLGHRRDLEVTQVATTVAKQSIAFGLHYVTTAAGEKQLYDITCDVWKHVVDQIDRIVKVGIETL